MSSNRYKVSNIIEHDKIAMTIPTSIPRGDGFLARIVKYFSLNNFIKTETKLYHNYMILKLCFKNYVDTNKTKPPLQKPK